jgi:hypothetical protein
VNRRALINKNNIKYLIKIELFDTYSKKKLNHKKDKKNNLLLMIKNKIEIFI